MKLGIGAAVLAGAASIGLGGFAGLAWIAPVPAEAAPAAREAKTGKAILAEQRRARGAYLARAANCMGCHTAQGGRAYAGGRSLSTPFGTFITPNITPDKATGIGQWNEDDFWRAMHEGKSRDGRPLYPAFPYTDADVRNAWQYEMARTADDVLDRRTRIGLLDEQAAREARSAVEAILAACERGEGQG